MGFQNPVYGKEEKSICIKERAQVPLGLGVDMNGNLEMMLKISTLNKKKKKKWILC